MRQTVLTSHRSGQHDAPPAIAVAGLTHRFGATVALSSIELRLAPGDRVALTGPNGSGKTTLLRILAGTLIPDAGQVRIGGHRPGSSAARRITGSCLLFERAFYDRLTVSENLSIFARLRLSRRAATAAVDAVLDELAITSLRDRELLGLSAGMRGQVAFARSLLGIPSVLLLDEPTRSLDAEAREALWAALERRSHAAVLLASHRSDDITRCGRLIELAQS